MNPTDEYHATEPQPLLRPGPRADDGHDDASAATGRVCEGCNGPLPSPRHTRFCSPKCKRRVYASTKGGGRPTSTATKRRPSTSPAQPTPEATAETPPDTATAVAAALLAVDGVDRVELDLSAGRLTAWRAR